ncbi:helicase-like protein [Alteribacter lacisalsi]|uniref:Helicase-like protein n=1 Tax=Alteribacter lacisalsi TaxID=2045244 RepID=A0A2W0HIK1_9BACI|nr:helicase-related protein [Alteribacter lacisalsi]PYZ96629.1 helicase-like protein [Alteribacter lacisalsi]
MTFQNVEHLISKESLDLDEMFYIFKWANQNVGVENSKVRDVILRIMDKKNSIPEETYPIIESLLEKVGFFPYINTHNIESSLKSLLHYEFYRSENITDIVMHSQQAAIYDKLERGKSVVLSAPTSFGKSLLIEEIVASKKYQNIVILLPTLALIDETRSKMSKYRDYYKLIFTTRQVPDSHNLFILTPERLMDYENLPSIDFFVIDEFYKVNDDAGNNDRANVLNLAFYMLLKQTKQFYLLGPNITSIPSQFEDEYNCEFIQSNFNTVTSNQYFIERISGEESLQLLSLVQKLKEPTLIYCKSPAEAEKIVKYVVNKLKEYSEESSVHDEVIDWLDKNIHPDWYLSKALKYKVGFHHGSMPRFLGRYIVNQFNAGNIDLLFCTSTLIEGINTTAKNVVIFHNKKGNSNLEYFDYKNIIGRAGRMKKHYVGDIYSFYSPPTEQDKEVDFPWYTQNDVSDEILIQLSDSDLKTTSIKQIEEYTSQKVLPLDVIQQNSNISVSGQINLAKEIESNVTYYQSHLSWTGIPKYKSLEVTCCLMWDHIVKPSHYIFTGRQLTFFINKYKQVNSHIPTFIDTLMKRNAIDADKAVQQMSSIVKNWFEYKFPKYLMALDRIQKSVFEKHGIVPGDYKYFSSSIESAFCHPSLAALQEFGLPISVLKKLEKILPSLAKDQEVDLDTLINEIIEEDISSVLEPFEITLVKETLQK